MYKMHPNVWCLVLGLKGASCTRVDTVRIFQDEIGPRGGRAPGSAPNWVVFDVVLRSVHERAVFHWTPNRTQPQVRTVRSKETGL